MPSNVRIKSPTNNEKARIAAWALGVPESQGLDRWLNHGRHENPRRWTRNYDLDQLRIKKPDKFLKKINARLAPEEAQGKVNRLYWSRILGSWDTPVVYWLRYTDPSTGDVYVSGVPHGDNINKETGETLPFWALYDYIETPDGSLVRGGRETMSIQTADEAMSWKYGLTLEQYKNIKQEA